MQQCLAAITRMCYLGILLSFGLGYAGEQTKSIISCDVRMLPSHIQEEISDYADSPFFMQEVFDELKKLPKDLQKLVDTSTDLLLFKKMHSSFVACSNEHVITQVDWDATRDTIINRQ